MTILQIDFQLLRSTIWNFYVRIVLSTEAKRSGEIYSARKTLKQVQGDVLSIDFERLTSNTGRLNVKIVLSTEAKRSGEIYPARKTLKQVQGDDIAD